MVVAKVVVGRFAGTVSPTRLRGGAGRRADEKRRSVMPERKRFGGKRKGTNAALRDVLSSLPSQNEDFIVTVLSKNDNIFSDLAYVENDAWWGWAFAPGGFVLGPSILFALYILVL